MEPDSRTPPADGRRLLWRRMLGLVWRYRWGCLQVLGLQLAVLLLGLAALGLVGAGVDLLRHHLTGGQAKPPRWPLGIEPPAGWPVMRIVWGVAGLIVAFAALRAALIMAHTLAVNRLLQGRLVMDLRERVYGRLQRMAFRFFDANASGTLINRATGDVQAVRSFVDGVVLQSAVLALTLGVYVAYMARIHLLLTLACLATVPLLAWVTLRFSARVRPAYLRERELFDRTMLALSESVQGQAVVKGFARREEEVAKFRAAAREGREQKHWIFRQVSVFRPLIGFLTDINIAVLLAYGGWLVVRHERAPDAASAALAGISIGELIVFTRLLQQFSSQVGTMADIANSMQQSMSAAERVFEVLDTPPRIDSAPDAARPAAVRGALRLEAVSCAYREGQPVLQEVDLAVEAGATVAVLGATGSGKSTLLALVPRFLDPCSGRVLLDGTDLRGLDLRVLRRSVGTVFQESFLFSNTVAANIAFGEPGASRARIEAAARVAAAHDFISGLPEGYDTMLFEGGANLSGGQRQRLALARALLPDPRILLLDDFTAAMDPGTEEEILAALERAMEGRTVLMVASRLSTLRRAGRVIVLDRGRVVQDGTHDELMEEHGHYRQVARLQSPDEAGLRRPARGPEGRP